MAPVGTVQEYEVSWSGPVTVSGDPPLIGCSRASARLRAARTFSSRGVAPWIWSTLKAS